MAYEIAEPRIVKWAKKKGFHFMGKSLTMFIIGVHAAYNRYLQNTENPVSIEKYLDAMEHLVFCGEACAV